MLPISPLRELMDDNGHWSVLFVGLCVPPNRRVDPGVMIGEIVGDLVGRDLFAGVRFVFGLVALISSYSACFEARMDEN